jgi:hypothetical protein
MLRISYEIGGYYSPRWRFVVFPGHETRSPLMKFGGSIYLHVGIEHSQTAQSKIDNEEEKQAKNNEGKNQEKKT